MRTSLIFLLLLPATITAQGVQQVKFQAPKKIELSALKPHEREFFLSAQRGADWLARANRPDGRFVYGFLPALRQPMEGDHFPRQVSATLSLARAARLLGDEKAATIARQACLSLMLETATDPKQPNIRFPAAPAALLNRPATAGLLVAAIHELPNPGEDLVTQARQLCAFLAQELRSDGSFHLSEDAGDQEAMRHFSGPAMYGVAHSQMGKTPEAWAVELLRRSRDYYLPRWQKDKNQPQVLWTTAAFAEAYLLTKDKAYADAVFEMNDWLCGMQYQNVDARRKHWQGGFMPWVDGKAVSMPPDVHSAEPAQSLAHACRVARAVGDVARLDRYRQALENSLRFVIRHQYTEGNTQHFAEWYQKALIGGFHASSQDGNIRLDYSADAVAALTLYFQHAADLK